LQRWNEGLAGAAQALDRFLLDKPAGRSLAEQSDEDLRGDEEDGLYVGAERNGLAADDGQRRAWATIRSGLDAGPRQSLMWMVGSD
jgi:hypothetical protein